MSTASSEAQVPVESVGALASRGIFWSLVQNWGAKISTFVIFVLLARFLSPSDYGLASAALSVLLLIGLVAEFGFGDAIIQRRTLLAKDVNLPFFVALGTSVGMALIAVLASGQIETVLKSPGLGTIVIASAAIAPLTTISLFQEVNYRRQLQFRSLAFRVLISNLLAGAVAVGLAYVGMGVWSLIAQAYLAVLISIAWLWSRPRWVPSRAVERQSFIELARFGISVVSLRLLDFGATRLVEVLILWRYGLAVLGLYAVGSRLYLVLMQLLQSALNDVSLTVLSRISHEQERLAGIYVQAITIASIVAAPVFVGCAVLAPEICHILFGAAWNGVDVIARPLLLLGAVQSVQYLNGPYLAARGRPNIVLAIAAVKYGLIIIGLLAVPSGDAAALVTLFALFQLVATPLTFEAVRRELGLTWRQLFFALSPSTIACTVGYGTVVGLQFWLPAIDNPYLSMLAWGALFALAYAAVIALLGRKQVAQIIRFLAARLAERKSAAVGISEMERERYEL